MFATYLYQGDSKARQMLHGLQEISSIKYRFNKKSLTNEDTFKVTVSDYFIGISFPVSLTSLLQPWSSSICTC